MAIDVELNMLISPENLNNKGFAFLFEFVCLKSLVTPSCTKKACKSK